MAFHMALPSLSAILSPSKSKLFSCYARGSGYIFDMLKVSCFIAASTLRRARDALRKTGGNCICSGRVRGGE
jgi:hypothetical protein